MELENAMPEQEDKKSQSPEDVQHDAELSENQSPEQPSVDDQNEEKASKKELEAEIDGAESIDPEATPPPEDIVPDADTEITDDLITTNLPDNHSGDRADETSSENSSEIETLPEAETAETKVDEPVDEKGVEKESETEKTTEPERPEEEVLTDDLITTNLPDNDSINTADETPSEKSTKIETLPEAETAETKVDEPVDEKGAEKKPETKKKTKPKPQEEEVIADEKEVEAKQVTVSDTVPKEEPTSIEEPSEEKPEDKTEITAKKEENIKPEKPAEPINFEKMAKNELVDFIVELSNETDMRRVDHLLKDIKPPFDHIFETEKSLALETFTKEGNEEADFSYKGDELDERFNDYFNLLKEKRNQFFHQLEIEKDNNLKKKQEILDKIREQVDGEESNMNFKVVKELQEEWKKTGPVPHQHNKTIWANYNALLDRFYDARSIYFELKELDRKKNLEAKLELCERADTLDKLENIKDAIGQLNELHEEFKSIGPVPREKQEELWQRFKSASDKIYDKRKIYVDSLKKDLTENMVKKSELGDEAMKFVDFQSDNLSEWNKKTKEILDLQKKWEAIGGLPREKAKEINKKFWSSFKQFFHNKNQFFKGIEAQRDDNLKAKELLIEQANEIKDSEDWNATAEKMKQLQQQWRDIGPVPEKNRNEVYKRFKDACDHFFNQRRSQTEGQQVEFEENLKRKVAICEELEKLILDQELDFDKVDSLVQEFTKLGFVPRNAIKSINARFNDVIRKLEKSKDLTQEDVDELKINIEVTRMKGTPHGEQKLHRKEGALKRKINNLEVEIGNWRTNLDFFADSKNADQFKKEYEVKIDKAQSELESLKNQLRMLHQT